MANGTIEAPALVAYRINLPNGRTQVAGKLIRVNADLVFYRAHRLTRAELHKWHALSFDVRILSHLRAAGVAYVDHRSDDDLYRISLEDFAANAVEQIHSRGEGPQHYVDRDHWRLISPLPYRAGFTEREQLITGYAATPAKMPAPLSSIVTPRAEAPSPQPRLGL